MNFSIYFLLISCLSIIISESSPFPDYSDLEKIASGNQLNIIGSKKHVNLKLSKGGEIFRNEYALVWKGTFNDSIDVAIKIVSKQQTMKDEMDIFDALKATENFDIKKHRIPRVYYSGPIFGNYFAIAMTLFEGTLQNVYEQFERDDKHFSESTVLLIFKQAVESLKYIHNKNVAHNDIKPRNIFVRGNDVFLADFDSSELGGDFIEDYDTLLTWMWEMVGVSISDLYASSAVILTYFKNPTIQEAFRSILNTKKIDTRVGTLPDYKKIIKIAEDALAQIGPVQFDWLRGGTHASSSGQSSK